MPNKFNLRGLQLCLGDFFEAQNECNLVDCTCFSDGIDKEITSAVDGMTSQMTARIPSNILK